MAKSMIEWNRVDGHGFFYGFFYGPQDNPAGVWRVDIAIPGASHATKRYPPYTVLVEGDAVGKGRDFSHAKAVAEAFFEKGLHLAPKFQKSAFRRRPSFR